MLNERNWLTLAEAASHMKVSQRTIRRRIADGTVTAARFGPRLVRVDAESLNQAPTVN